MTKMSHTALLLCLPETLGAKNPIGRQWLTSRKALGPARIFTHDMPRFISILLQDCGKN